MAVLQSVVTNLARQLYPQFFGGLLGISAGATAPNNWNPLIRYFRIGRGGWYDTGSGVFRRNPDPALPDLDIIVDEKRTQRRYPATGFGNIYYFEKALNPGDFTWEAPSVLKISTFLNFGEFNATEGVPTTPPGGPILPGPGSNPDLYEIGVFADYPDQAPPNVPDTWTPPDCPAYNISTHPVTPSLMVLYATFAKQTKTAGTTLQNDLRFIF